MPLTTTEILLTVDGTNVIANTKTSTFHRESGVQITVERVVNKCKVKLANHFGLLRMATFNGTKYAVLPDDTIITLAQTSAGKAVFADPNHGARKQILATCKSQ